MPPRPNRSRSSSRKRPLASARARSPGGSSPPLARFLHELGQLKRVRRSGWWLAGVRDPESVAEHSFRAAAIAYCLARLEGANAERAAAIALFHDAAEARVGDLHRLAKRYAPWDGVEDAVARDQAAALPRSVGESLLALRSEGAARKSPEARVAKDADLIECLLQAREYAAEGHRVERWIESSLAGLSTRAGKALARDVLATPPEAWWKEAMPLRKATPRARPIPPGRRRRGTR